MAADNGDKQIDNLISDEPEESEEEDVDAFALLSGMGVESKCSTMVTVGLVSADVVASAESKPVCEQPKDDQQAESDLAADDEASAASCSEFWKRQDTSQTLLGCLCRHLIQLQTKGFKLPWPCRICGCMNGSWLGACESCRSSNEGYEAAAAALAADAPTLAEDSAWDHVLVELARRRGAREIEACFLMCEALAVPPDRGVILYRRAFRLWPALDSYLYPDGVPEALRAEADVVLTSRSCATATTAIFPSDFDTPLSIACSSSDGIPGQPDSTKPDETTSQVLVVFSYHQESGTSPGKWWDQALRSASMVKHVHRHSRVALQVLSNVETKGHDKEGVFDEHVWIDLAREAQLPGTGRALCGTKIQAMIHCLEKGFRKVVYMDSDTHILRPFLTPILSALEFYDVTGVFEGPPLGLAQTGLDPLLEDPQNQEFGYELNTGVLGVRTSALMLCRAWLDEFRAHAQRYASVSSADQPALMQVLRRRSERVFPLPPTLNFRPFTVFSPTGHSVPAIIHDHADDSEQAHKQVVEAVCSHMHYGLRWK